MQMDTASRSQESVPSDGGNTMQCAHCGFVASPPGRFCPACGAQSGFAFPVQNLQPYPAVPPQPPPYHAARGPHGQVFVRGVEGRARGFSQIFGIHPAIAFLTLIVDMMLFGGAIATLGAILPVSIGAGCVLGVIAYLAQKKWYGDDKESAGIKALILAFLTAIPTPLPAILTVPSGIVGLIHGLRRK